jgi:hypothetical protein
MSILWYFYIYRIWYLIWHPNLSKGLGWWLTHSVTLALDVPNTGTIRSGELENRQRFVVILAFLLLLGPIRKRIQYLLVLNIRIGWTNRTPQISMLWNKTLQSNRLSQGRHILGSQVMLVKISSSSSSGLSIPFPFSISTSFHIAIPDQRENTINFKTFLTDSLFRTDEVMALDYYQPDCNLFLSARIAPEHLLLLIGHEL